MYKVIKLKRFLNTFNRQLAFLKNLLSLFIRLTNFIRRIILYSQKSMKWFLQLEHKYVIDKVITDNSLLFFLDF